MATEWVPDPSWTVLSATTNTKCRFMARVGGRNVRCEHQAVAQFLRNSRKIGPRWWAYCEQHLYGRRLRNGLIETERRHERN